MSATVTFTRPDIPGHWYISRGAGPAVELLDGTTGHLFGEYRADGMDFYSTAPILLLQVRSRVSSVPAYIAVPRSEVKRTWY